MDKATIRMTHATAMVLQALANGHAYGFEIMDVTGLPGGTIYPALRRLEAAGLVDAEWEEGRVAQERGRPARKYYRLTASGAEALGEAAERFRLVGIFGDRTAAEQGS
jgi:DNA-binding PadR family transcriptional regulator